MKSNAFIRDFVIPSGGVLVKRDGHHHHYRLPNGRTFVVPVGGTMSEAGRYLLPKLRRALAEPPRKEGEP